MHGYKTIMLVVFFSCCVTQALCNIAVGYVWNIVLLKRIKTNAFKVFPLTEQCRGLLPAVPAVVLEHVEGSVSEQGSASHGLVAWLLLGITQLLHHTLTVPQQLLQAQLPAERYTLSEHKDTVNIMLH